MAITTHEHQGHGDHGHDHEGAVGPHTHLTSVGIDIGSSTSHLMFSQLLIGYPSVLQRKPIVLERNVIARSPILLTPFSGDWNIEAGPLRELVDDTFQDAGLTRDDIDTGAVIITGEAARRDNAQKIAELFSDEAGRFVCATAGPTLETIMAAHGSGAVQQSREQGLVLLNIDVGGGTTKISLIDNGKIRATTAVNIGARLVAHDGADVDRPLGKRRAAVSSRSWAADSISARRVPDDLRARLANRMAQALFDALTTGAGNRGSEFYVIRRAGRTAGDRWHSLLGRRFGIYLRARNRGVRRLGSVFSARAIRGEAERRGFEYSRSRRGHPRHGYRGVAVHGAIERRDDLHS